MEITKPEESFVARALDYPDIARQITQKIISDSTKIHACNSCWASEAAHDCMRYLVYQQCDWDKAKQTDDNLLLVFHEGNLQEDNLLLELQKAGIRVKDLQVNIKIAEANITGKLDCVAEIEGTDGKLANIPVEIKSMSDIVYNSVNTVEDFKKFPWTRKYYGQMQSYLKNDAWFFEYGYFLAKNKSTGAIKLIRDFDGSNTIKFNPEYWAWMVQRGKEVQRIVLANKILQMQIDGLKSQLTGKETKKEKTLQEKINKLENKIFYPDRIKYDLKVCKGCKYEHICIADLSGVIGDIIDNPSIISAIDDYVKATTEREKGKDLEKTYQNALGCLKTLFPLEDASYIVADKYIVQTKVCNAKTKYLKFDVKGL